MSNSRFFFINILCLIIRRSRVPYFWIAVFPCLYRVGISVTFIWLFACRMVLFHLNVMVFVLCTSFLFGLNKFIIDISYMFNLLHTFLTTNDRGKNRIFASYFLIIMINLICNYIFNLGLKRIREFLPLTSIFWGIHS